MVSPKIFIRDCCKKMLSLAGAYDWRHRGAVVLITYHRVLPQVQLSTLTAQASLIVSTEAFERNMRFLRARYTLLSFNEYLDRVDSGNWAREQRYAIVTFDDGCFDNYVYAFPILAKYSIPATIFVVTGYIDTCLRFWWQVIGDAVMSAHLCADHQQPLIEATQAHVSQETQALRQIFRARRAGHVSRQTDSLIERLKTYPLQSVQHFVDDCAAISKTPLTPMAMTWKQVAEMSAHGIEFGSHSVNHHLLTALPLEDATREIVDSASVLRSHPDVNFTPVFSYPNGNVNDQICDLVREAGYRAAVSTDPRVAGFRPGNPYRLPRINIAGRVAASNLLFKFKLACAVADQSCAPAETDRAQA